VVDAVRRVVALQAQAAASPYLALWNRLDRFDPADLDAAFADQAVVKATPMAGDVEQLEGPDGTALFDVPGALLPPEDTPAPPRLLPMWDSILLAYADRSRVIPPDYRRLVTRNNGDALPTLLVDGYVAGVWRPFEGGIEATAFHPLPDEAWSGLAAEADALVAFLADRDPAVYRRYAHWWEKLPSAERRVLPD
jgi:winged helix DNA-binding protein